jgi:hypothetical protein
MIDNIKISISMESNNLKHLSTGEPTYWPHDRNKLPDLVDLCVTKGIPQECAVAKSCFDLSPGHSPILTTLIADALNREKNKQTLSNMHTNWDDFRRLVNEIFTFNIPSKPRKTLKQQPSSSAIQLNVQVGMQRRNM